MPNVTPHHDYVGGACFVTGCRVQGCSSSWVCRCPSWCFGSVCGVELFEGVSGSVFVTIIVLVLVFLSVLVLAVVLKRRQPRRIRMMMIVIPTRITHEF